MTQKPPEVMHFEFMLNEKTKVIATLKNRILFQYLKSRISAFYEPIATASK